MNAAIAASPRSNATCGSRGCGVVRSEAAAVGRDVPHDRRGNRRGVDDELHDATIAVVRVNKPAIR